MKASWKSSPNGTIGVDAGHTIEGAKSKALDECGITFLHALWTLRRTYANLSHTHPAKPPLDGLSWRVDELKMIGDMHTVSRTIVAADHEVLHVVINELARMEFVACDIRNIRTLRLL